MLQSSEPSSKRWKPMRCEGVDRGMPAPLGERIETWSNDRYYATVRRYSRKPFPLGSNAFVVIGISRCDETCVRDWRDLQYAKNDIVGAEWEAVELFPAESRKVDPSNRFYLSCFPPGTFMRVGLDMMGERRVIGPQDAKAPQRAFYAGTPH